MNKVQEKTKNILQKMRPMDFIIVGVFVFILVIFALIMGGKKIYSPTPVVNEGKVTYDVFFKNLIITGEHNPFKVGDETFVTIRNVPHAKLKITSFKYDRKRLMLPTGNAAKPYLLVEDHENPNSYDFIVTVEDTAKITNDGIVSGGNKIKIGLPITLESPEYRFNGVISNIQIVKLNNDTDE